MSVLPQDLMESGFVTFWLDANKVGAAPDVITFTREQLRDYARMCYGSGWFDHGLQLRELEDRKP